MANSDKMQLEFSLREMLECKCRSVSLSLHCKFWCSIILEGVSDFRVWVKASTTYEQNSCLVVSARLQKPSVCGWYHFRMAAIHHPFNCSCALDECLVGSVPNVKLRPLLLLTKSNTNEKDFLHLVRDSVQGKPETYFQQKLYFQALNCRME